MILSLMKSKKTYDHDGFEFHRSQIETKMLFFYPLELRCRNSLRDAVLAKAIKNQLEQHRKDLQKARDALQMLVDNFQAIGHISFQITQYFSRILCVTHSVWIISSNISCRFASNSENKHQTCGKVMHVLLAAYTNQFSPLLTGETGQEIERWRWSRTSCLQVLPRCHEDVSS